MNTSLKQFEQKLTEINELESVKKAKEIISQAKVKLKNTVTSFNSFLKADVAKQNEAILKEVSDKVKVIKETTGAAASKVILRSLTNSKKNRFYLLCLFCRLAKLFLPPLSQ